MTAFHSTFRRAQARYDAMEEDLRDLDAATDRAIETADDFDATDRSAWLAHHDLELSADLRDGWARAHKAAVVRTAYCHRTLYRARGYQPLPFGVRS